MKPYSNVIRGRIARVEKVADALDKVIRATGEALGCARENLNGYKEIVEGAGYVSGVDPDEIVAAVKTAQVFVRGYSNKAKGLEKEQEGYRRERQRLEGR